MLRKELKKGLLFLATIPVSLSSTCLDGFLAVKISVLELYILA